MIKAIVADVALAIGGSFAAALLVKVTLTLVLALAAARLAPRSRAAVRHVWLATAFAVLLALPAASVVVPSRDMTVPTAAVTTQRPAAVVSVAVSTAPPALPGPGRPDWPGGGSSPVPVSGLLWTIWSAGALLCLLPVLAGMWQVRSLRGSGAPWPDGGAQVRQLAADAGLHRPVDVRLHESIPGPMTFGIIRPAIVLPSDAGTWSDEELRRALIHELEHVRRGDWASQCLVRVVCALYWFHPLAWIAWRRLRLEAERACDDAVLRRAEATAYADQLILLAERLSLPATPPLVGMAGRRDLTTRVLAVLDGEQARGQAGAGRVATAIAAATMLIGAIAPLRAVPQGPAASALSQQPMPAFETASVKPNRTGADEQFVRGDPGGNLTVVNMPLRQLIVFAYQIQGFQLDGGPDWIVSDRFDILARAGRAVPVTAPVVTAGPDTLRPMLRALLADRFRLVVHKETKELPIFELVRARPGDKPGPQLRPASTDCAALAAARESAARRGGAPAAAPGPPGFCGVTMNFGRIRFGGNPLAVFANALSPLAQRVVVDRTDLAGNWEFELTFTPDQTQLPPGAPPGVQLPNVDPNGASLFTALEEQLGLKLQATRGPVEVLVIDRVEQPTGN